MAMNIISKEKKEIKWIGLPTNSAQECQQLEVPLQIFACCQSLNYWSIIFLDPHVKRIERIEILALRVFDISTFLYNVNDNNYDILDTRSYRLVRVYSYTSYIFYIYT